MPTLTWIGKDKVVNHHHDVPFRVLEQQYGFGTADSKNRIIHGDNLEALKALLPYYEGRIKCIYIDPPYNTGNENWVYNDNVSDPKFKRWLGKVVGKESEDLTRHDKWLCMMYPRLVLLHQLLADDGAIFVSIDDNEQASLKLMMDEIWGRNNYLTCFIWKRRSGSNDSKNFLSVDHEYLAVYQKTDKLLFTGVVKDLSNYKNPDNDSRGAWAFDNLTCNKTREERPNLYYDITDPITGITYSANPNRVWVYEKNRMARLIGEGKVLFPKSDKGTPQYKRHLSELRHLKKPVSSWIFPSSTKDEVVGISASLNSTATKEVRSIFNEQIFNYPKPADLLEGILQQITGPDDIILDSFAGSGTTAHAVLNLNKQDGGNRQFILVEMEEYAETITAERVRRVIDGYGTKEGTGGGFAYYELGPALFTDDNLLNEGVPLARIREYVWYSETRTPLTAIPAAKTGEGVMESAHFLGELFDTAYYFYYEPTELTTLDYDFLSTIQTPAGQYVVYADNCLIAREWLQERHIVFKKIPRDISRF